MNSYAHCLRDYEIDKLKMSDPPHTPRHRGDPVRHYTTGWYFWSETWTDCYGPYRSLEECDEACNDYAKKI